MIKFEIENQLIRQKFKKFLETSLFYQPEKVIKSFPADGKDCFKSLDAEYKI